MSQQDSFGPPSGPVQSPEPSFAAYPGAQQQGYAPEGYAGEGHASQGYPPPGYGYDPQRQKTNTMAILGLVFAFVFSPLGVVFSAIGLSQIKKRREGGRGLALAGLILSIVFLAISAIFIVVALTVATTAVDTATSNAAAAARSTASVPADGDTGTGTPAGSASGVVTACQAIVPALLKMETDMANVTSVDDYAQALATLEGTLNTAAAGTSDATFQKDVASLAADLQQASASVQNGDDPSSLVSAMNDDGSKVGTDCGNAGFTQ